MPHSKIPTLISRLCLPFMILLCAVTARSEPPKYIVTDLGVGDGYSFAIGNAVNNSGVAAGYTGSGNAFWRAFRASSSGGMTTLNIFSGGSESFGLGINDSGVVVGYSDDSTGIKPVMYPAGSSTPVKLANNGTAYAISNNGKIVGQSGGTAFVYDTTAGSPIAVSIGTLPGATSSIAYAINENGQIVGASQFPTATNPSHAFKYSGGVMTDIGTLPGDNASYAFGNNNAGDVVGYSFNRFTNGEQHAFLYHNGVMTQLGPNGKNTQANDINNSGVAVGEEVAIYGTLAPLIFIDGQTFNLNDYLTGGWVMNRATAINDSGQIVGSGYVNGAGYPHAILLTPVPVQTGPNYTVTNTSDNDGTCAVDNCSLREAIKAANSDANDSTISFNLPSIPQTIQLTKALPILTYKVIIDGPSDDTVTIRGESTDNPYVIFGSAFGDTTLRHLKITNGRASGAAVSAVFSILKIEYCSIFGNINDSQDSSNGGGGIYCYGKLTLDSSSVYGNFAKSGGGVFVNTATGNDSLIQNSTIANNQVSDVGAGVMNYGGHVLVEASTITGNSAVSNGGGVASYGDSVTSTEVENTIVAGNNAAANTDLYLYNDTTNSFLSRGYNLIGAGAGSAAFNNTGDKTGLVSADLHLGPLQDNGGSTPTVALLAGSPAINAGNNPNAPSVDQRTVSRPRGGKVDIGAFESNTGASGGLIVTVLEDTDDGDYNPDDISLREAIEFANSNPDNSAITFDLPVSLPRDLSLTQALPALSTPMTITGPTTGELTIKGEGSADKYRIFTISNGTQTGPAVGISNLRLNNGWAAGSVAPAGRGGAILNDHGTLTLTKCTLEGNRADVSGGALFNYANGGGTATANLLECTLTGNNGAGAGGGILNNGDSGTANLNLTNCTISGNTANNYGGVANVSSNAGDAETNIKFCTFYKNSGDTEGCNLANDGASGGTAHTQVGNSLFVKTTAQFSFLNQTGTFTSNGYNISDDNAGGDGNTAPGGLLNGTSDLRNTDPKIGSLQNNGGPTKTHAILFGSQAINNGNNTGAPSVDQRGVTRPFATTVDIGAYESNFSVGGPNFVVTTTEDTDDGDYSLNDISLREAITFANLDPDSSIITFDIPGGGPHTIQLDTPLPSIATNTTITGPTDEKVTVRGEGTSSPYRIFNINNGVVAAISDLTVTNGGTANAFSLPREAAPGAGINNAGTLTLTNVTVSGNQTGRGADASDLNGHEPGHGGDGGGIYNSGVLTLQNCTVSNNKTGNGGLLDGGAPRGLGGGIYSSGALTIINSTISGNQCGTSGSGSTTYGNGGGLFSTSSPAMTNCTVTGNSAFDGGGINTSGGGSLHNCIVAGNSASDAGTDLSGSFTSEGHNLIGNADGSSGFTATGDQIGTTASPLKARLGSLQDNGGSTFTHALQLGSPAIDGADDAVLNAPLSLSFDQRGTGFDRKKGDRVDIGAFESNILTPASLIVTTTESTDDGNYAADDLSLPEAIEFANANADVSTITFDIPGAGPHTIQLAQTLPDLTTSMDINGPSDESVTIRGEGSGNKYRLLNISSGVTVNLKRLNFTNGYADGTDRERLGGAIFNDLSTLALDSCTFTGNHAGDAGGALFTSGALSLTNCTISDNSAQFTANAIYASPYGGGPTASITLTNCTVADNTGGSSQIRTDSDHGEAAITLKNTILRGNGIANFVLDDTTFTSLGHNLSDDAAGGDGGTGPGGLLNGTGDIRNTNPRLVALGSYGGSTQTRPLGFQSPAVDAGDDTGAPAKDQRGVDRPIGAHVDIGSYESSGSPSGPNFVVTTTEDIDDGDYSASDISLREAIEFANSNADNSTITFNIPGSGPHTIQLVAPLPDLTTNININGPSDEKVTVRRNVDTQFRIFTIPFGTNTVNIANLTISNGYAENGGGVDNQGATVSLTNCTVSGNQVLDPASNSDGGGIRNGGAMTLTGCTISGNTALSSTDTRGGGIFNDGTLTMTNCTVSGNTSEDDYGGGIDNAGTLSLVNCTVTNNSSVTGSGLYHEDGTANIKNTIISGNSSVDNVAGGAITDQGGNILGGDAKLNPLADNGGPTQTHALQAGSPAIDAGSDTVLSTPLSLTTDQRGTGFPRKFGAHVDSGAFESNTSAGGGLVVTVAEDTDDGNYAADDISLREAIKFANGNPDTSTITFALGPVPVTIQLGSALPDLTTNININGPTDNIITVRGEGAGNPHRLFNVVDGTTVAISNLTMSNGYSDKGGALYSEGNLSLTHCNFTGNTASSADAKGGAVATSYLTTATTNVVTACTFSGNSAVGSGASGGAIDTVSMTIKESTFNNNTVSGASGRGGAVSAAATTIYNCTFTGNKATGTTVSQGGALYLNIYNALLNCTVSKNSVNGPGSNFGGGVFFDSADNTFANCIVTANTEAGSGNETNAEGDSNALAAKVNCLITGDAKLGPLQNNGGPTSTMALAADSPAIDAGSDTVLGTLTTDQRGEGYARKFGSHVDIGAFELQSTNHDPILENIPTGYTYAGEKFQYNAASSDPDEGDVRTYSLEGAPVGMTIDPVSGLIIWQTGYGTATGPYTFTVRVSDNHGASASQVVTVNVAPRRYAPVLTPIGAKSVNEETKLTIVLSATDQDTAANRLSFYATSLPAGATFTTATKTFTWTPTEAQGPGTYDVTFRVNDGALDGVEKVRITVNEVNKAPVLNVGAAKTFVGDKWNGLSVTATDPDLPANTLTYSVAQPAAIAGVGTPQVNVNSSTGAISVYGPPSTANYTIPLSIKVTDNGTPALSDTKTLNVTITPPLVVWMVVPTFTATDITLAYKLRNNSTKPLTGVWIQGTAYSTVNSITKSVGTVTQQAQGGTQTGIVWNGFSLNSGAEATLTIKLKRPTGSGKQAIGLLYPSFSTVGNGTVPSATPVVNTP